MSLNPGYSRSSSAPTPAVLPPYNVAFAMGDSLSAGASLEPGINGATALLAGDSLFEYACILSGQRIRRGKNAGIAGQTSSLVLARLASDVIAYKPNTCIILDGTNDIGGSVSAGGAIPDATVLATWQANKVAQITMLRANGIAPVVCTIPPHFTFSHHALTMKMNAWLIRYAAAKRVPVMDLYGQSVDPTTGNYLASMASGDGVHPGPAGLQILGQYVANTLGPLMPALSGAWLARDGADASNMVTQGLFLGGAVSGQGIPPGWALNSGFPTGITGAYVVDGAIPGNMWQVTAAASSGAYNVISNNFIGSCSPGDVLALSGVITTDAGYQPQLQLINQGGVFARSQLTRAMTRGTIYFECALPAASTAAYVSIPTPAGTGVTSYGQITVYNVTTGNALTFG